MTRWLWLGIWMVALSVACAEEEGRPDPMRGPDAGPRFVEQEESGAQDASSPRDRAEHVRPQEGGVGAADVEPAAAPDPASAEHATAEDGEPAPPPADIR